MLEHKRAFGLNELFGNVALVTFQGSQASRFLLHNTLAVFHIAIRLLFSTFFFGQPLGEVICPFALPS